MSSTFFGYSDARNEREALQHYFYRQPFYDEIKMRDKDCGVFIVVGVKGSGKTALGQAVENEGERDVVWHLEPCDGFEPDGKLRRASVAESVLTTVIATGVADRIRALTKGNKLAFSGEALDSMRKLEQGLLDKVKGFLSSTGELSLSVTGPAIRFDFSKMKRNKDLDAFQQIPNQVFVDALSPCLNEHQACVVIDDIDAIFPGSEQDDGFIEGVVNACTRLNTAFKKRLHCLLFLNAGMYEKYFKAAPTYDRSKEFVGKLIWNGDELCGMLATRIRHVLAIEHDEPAWESWGRAFEATDQQSVEYIQQYMVERCNSGPRDLINFGNAAKEQAGEQKVSMYHIQTAESEFSREKLYLLNRDYGVRYHKLAELLEAVFTHRPAKYRGRGKLEEYISTGLYGNQQVMDVYGDLDYVRYSQPRFFLELLYRVGFVGYRDSGRGPLRFSMSFPEPGDQLYNAEEHVIHLAYRSYLGLTARAPVPVRSEQTRRKGRKSGRLG